MIATLFLLIAALVIGAMYHVNRRPAMAGAMLILVIVLCSVVDAVH